MSQIERRVLVLTPNARDAEHSRRILAGAGVAATVCRDMDELCREVQQGAGAVLTTEEALALEEFDRLVALLRRQPAWSDLPVLLLTAGGADSAAVSWSMETMANVVLLQRPVHEAALIGAARFALRARARQFQLRDYIEERRQAEEALRQSETRYRTLFDSIDAGFCIIEVIFDETGKPVDYRFVETSPSFEKQTGLCNAQGKRMRELVPNHEQYWFDIYGRIALTGEPARFQNRAEQLQRWYDVYAFRLAPENRHVAILFNDINDRKRAEEALRQSGQRLTGIIDSAMDAIITADDQQRIALFNPAAQQMFRLPREDAIGAPLDRFIPPRLRERHREHVRNFARTGNTARGMGHLRPLSALRADGEEFPIEASISQVEVSGHKLFTVILRDITERKRAEEALEAALAKAEQASQAKDQFMAVLSHEMRNPLTPVTTGVALLRNRLRSDPEAQRILEVIGRNVELEARLIDDLLDMTRVARGKVELDRRPVAVCDILRRTTEACMPDVEARGLHFGVNIAKPAHLVHADPARLQQVFWNLLKNSIKFTPHGGCVGVQCRRQEGEVIVEIVDSGEGIEPEALGRIFSAFEQAERAVTRRFGGLGLGLAISKALVEMHGGSIEARSAGKGQGATFIVHLPLFVAGGVGAEPAAPAKQAADSQAVRPLRILLVEDHGDTANMLRQMLMLDGHSVEHAGDVATALDMTDKYPFDLLISDLGLPDASGFDLMRELRTRGSKMPGIALSGYGMDHDLERSSEAGFAVHLIKPPNPDRLAEAIAILSNEAAL